MLYKEKINTDLADYSMNIFLAVTVVADSPADRKPSDTVNRKCIFGAKHLGQCSFRKREHFSTI